MGGPGSGRKIGSTNKSSHGDTTPIKFGKSIQQGKGSFKNFEKRKMPNGSFGWVRKKGK